jgi:hypothetical protein
MTSLGCVLTVGCGGRCDVLSLVKLAGMQAGVVALRVLQQLQQLFGPQSLEGFICRCCTVAVPSA